MEKLARIGDIAKAYNISVGTLRHYEELGLLTPEIKDADSGYRYYGAGQFEILNTITYLRALGMPLSKIGEFLANRDVGVIEEKLEEQRTVVLKKRRELEIIEKKIDNRLRQIRDAKTSEIGKVRTVTSPKMRISSLKEELRPKGYLDMEGAIRRLAKNQDGATVFLGKVGVGISAERLSEKKFDGYDRIFLILDDVDKWKGDVTELEKTQCVTVRFRGGHADAPAEYEKLAAYMAENGLCPTGFSREITMIDYGFTNDTGKFVTEISIPVKEKNGN